MSGGRSAWRAVLALLLAGCAWPIRAQAQASPQPGPAIACRDAARRAEQAQGLPEGLLLAIGRQESGRWDAASGEFLPWPYAVNAAGESHFFASAAEAVAFVGTAQTNGVRLIDVGCFQIDLFYHPEEFANLADAFGPEANARAAAHILGALYRDTADWSATIGRYHSASPDLGDPYRDAVLSRWAGGGGTGKAGLAGKHIVRVMGMVVQRPGTANGGGFVAMPGRFLPRVITPGSGAP